MMKLFRIAVVTWFAAAASLLGAQPASAAAGMRISNGRLYESNGNELVLRGINHAHTWYATQTSSFANIKAAGANSIRVVLANGVRWTANSSSDVANVISLCKTNKLICILEVHDTTGYGEQSGAATLAQASDYFVGLQSVLTGQENYVIINIGNEPYGNNNTSGWIADTQNAIKRIRNAGLQHLIMVDAPCWGQDWNFTMRDNAPAVLAADSSGNTILSIHMYGVFNTASVVQAYIDSFRSRNLPLAVGEFGNMHTDGDPDEDTIMSYAQQNRIGFLGWSWSGNSSDVAFLDMVTSFNPAQRTSWGDRFITGANGLSTTSREATIYGGVQTDTQPPTTPGTPTASAVTANSANLSWTASSDNVRVTGYTVYSRTSSGDVSVASPTTNSASIGGLTASTTYTFYVKASDAAGNTSAASPTVTVTTSGGNLLALTVSKSGTGSGTVTSSSGGINCGSTCSASYTAGTVVTLTATAASGYTFTGWNGACSGTMPTCTITMNAAQSATATFNGCAGPGCGTGIFINSGGSATGTFQADAYYSGGSTYSNTRTIDTSLITAPVPPQSVFQTERYGPMTYTIPGFTAGSANTVTLYFAETYFSASGQRNFNVAINGTNVLSAFDIYAAAGAANKAVARTFNATANASGQIVIQFTNGSANSPKICGIAASGGGGGGPYTLTVTKAGTGDGTVSSSPAGISCGSTCSASYASGTSVTLTATPVAGSTFTSWSGACSGTSATCTVSMAAAQTVTAAFTGGGGPYTLTVNKGGTGSGTVTSSPAGISCGSTCSASYASGTSVTLTATLAAGSSSFSWSGACSGASATCTVTMTAAQTVTANFIQGGPSVTLTVNKSGTGAGTVSSSPAGISCGSTCSASYVSGTSVTLTASPDAGSTFAGWSGACSGTSATCTVSMAAVQTVTAAFTGGGTCLTPASNGQSGNFNTTGAACYTVSATIHGWGCSNADGRTVSVNGSPVTCGQMPLPGASPYTFSFTAGTYPWASFYWW